MITKIIKFLIKKGNKPKTTMKFLELCNTILINFNKIPLIYFFSIIFKRLHTNVELIHTNYRRQKHTIPAPINHTRKFYLFFKWLNCAIQKTKLKISYFKKLYNELLNIILKKSYSVTLKLKKENELQAYKFQAKRHFRWY